MHLHCKLEWIFCAPVLLLAIGCGATRDVEVSGEITPSASAAADEPVRLEFYERSEPETEGEEGSLELVHSAVLEEPGAFKETVPLVGDDLVVVAIVDSDGNEACTDGEAWGIVETTVDENDSVSLSLGIDAQTACPALESTE